MTRKWEAIMALSLDDLRTEYAFGAIQEGEKWRPAGEDEVPDGYLEDLEKAKRQREQKPRLLHRQSYRGYTDQPALAMKPDAGEAPPKDWVDQRTAESRLSFGTEKVAENLSRLMGERDALRAQLEAYKALGEKQGVDVRSNIRLVERGLRALDRQLGLEEAA